MEKDPSELFDGIVEINSEAMDSMIEVLDQIDEVYDQLTETQAKLGFAQDFKQKYPESEYQKQTPYSMIDFINLIDMDFGDLVTFMNDIRDGATDEIIELESKNIDLESMDETKLFYVGIRMGQKIDFLKHVENDKQSQPAQADDNQNDVDQNSDNKQNENQTANLQGGQISGSQMQKLQEDLQEIKTQLGNLREVVLQEFPLKEVDVDEIAQQLGQYLGSEERTQQLQNIQKDVLQVKSQIQKIKSQSFTHIKQKLQQIIKLNEQNISHNSIQPVVYQQTLLDKQQYNQRKLQGLKKCMGEQVFVPSVHSIQRQKMIAKLQKMKRQITDIKMTQVVIENLALHRINNLETVYQQCLTAIYSHLNEKLKKNQFSSIQYQEIYNKQIGNSDVRLQQVTDAYKKLINIIVEDQDQLNVLSNEYVIVNKILNKVFDLGDILAQDLNQGQIQQDIELSPQQIQQSKKPDVDEFSNSVE